MAGFTEQIDIDGEPGAVFTWATDPDHASIWLDIIRMEPRDEKPMAKGSVYRETRRMGKREVSADITITEHIGPGQRAHPPYEHAGSSAAMGVEATYRYTFSASPAGGTRVDLVCEVVPRSFLGRFMAGPLVKIMKKMDAGQLSRLKVAYEEAHAGA
ncbi:MAG: SRPBCC family protein [Phycisphaerales bacterium]|nr:SRPBCC family protein [Phycisphaerales bacterium]